MFASVCLLLFVFGTVFGIGYFVRRKALDKPGRSFFGWLWSQLGDALNSLDVSSSSSKPLSALKSPVPKTESLENDPQEREEELRLLEELYKRDAQDPSER